MIASPPFCLLSQSLTSLRVITNTNTVTSGVTTVVDSTKTITDATITTTVIEPSTLSTKTTSTSVISAVTTTTITACANPVTRKARRAVSPTGYKNDPTWLEDHGIDPLGEEKRGLIPKPKCFANYVDPAAVSYACNCLSVPTRTTTSTTTLRTKTATAVTTVGSLLALSTRLSLTHAPRSPRLKRLLLPRRPQPLTPRPAPSSWPLSTPRRSLRGQPPTPLLTLRSPLPLPWSPRVVSGRVTSFTTPTTCAILASTLPGPCFSSP